MRKYIKQWSKGCNIVVVNIDKCSDSEVSVVVIVPGVGCRLLTISWPVAQQL